MSRLISVLGFLAILSAPIGVYATNGMNLEGYGPIATAMGGASMAYDNGTAAVINNPATLALSGDGRRADLALGLLGPNVNSSAMGQTWGSDGDYYYMPAFGWTSTSNDTTWGVAVFAQGGMGTDYSPGPGSAFAAQQMSTGNTATGMGTADSGTISTAGKLMERSEVGVGRLMFPVARSITDKLTIGGTVDFVWASLDLKMVMPGAQMMQMISGGLIDGSMVTGLQTAIGAGNLNDVYYGYFDFSNNSDYTGKASATGFAGKLGLTYHVNERLTLGAVYHSKTDIADMDGKATVSMVVNADQGYLAGSTNTGIFTDAAFPLQGTIKIRDFQWPETYAAGLAYQATPRVLLVADIKRIRWSDVMENFRMSFTASNAATNGDFKGLTMNATLPQNWDDQTVIQLGVNYQANDKWILRGGYNGASNPVPDSWVHYLFPATVEKHYTAGAGYLIDDANAMNFSLTFTPTTKVTSADGIDITHSQSNWQLMYTHYY